MKIKVTPFSKMRSLQTVDNLKDFCFHVVNETDQNNSSPQLTKK